MNRSSIQLAGTVVVLGLAIAIGAFITRPDDGNDGTGNDSESTHVAEDHRGPSRSGIALEGVGDADGARGEMPTRQPESTNRLSLLVSVVDPAWVPVTDGTIVCQWSAPDKSPGECRVSTPIRAEETAIEIATDAAELSIAAFAPGYDWSEVGVVPVPRVEPGQQPVVQRLQVRLRKPTTGPALSGVVFLSGARRVPQGLSITVPGNSDATAVLDLRKSTYTLGPVQDADTGLWVTSEEAAPLWQPADTGSLATQGTLDLHLESARAISLHFLDGQTSLPLKGVDVWCEYRCLDVGIIDAVSRVGAARGRTDSDGVYVLRCLPIIGSYTVGLQGDPRVLLQRGLTSEYPRLADETILVFKGTAEVWGTIDFPATDSVHVRYAAARGGRSIEVDGSAEATLGSDGRWSFDVPVPSDWLVWAEQDGTRLTDMAKVTASRPETVGPVSLIGADRAEVTVRIKGGPGNGLYRLYVTEGDGPRTRHELTATREEIEIRLRVGGSARVVLLYKVARESRESWQVARDFDPGVVDELVFDLGSFVPRSVAITINGVAPTGRGSLGLTPLKDAANDVRLVQFLIDDGKGANALSLPPGIYSYTFHSEKTPGYVAGVATIRDGHEFVLDWRGRKVPKSELGIGVIVRELDGVSIEPCTIMWEDHWDSEIELLVPLSWKAEVVGE